MRNIPVITKNLLIINVLMFLATYVFQRTGVDLNELLGLHFVMASNFRIYQFVTYMFMHGGFAHLFFNMFALWMFGCVVENVWGPKKFLFYYILCGIGAGLTQELAQFVNYYLIEGLGAYDYVNLNGVSISVDAFLNQLTTVGASGAIYGILLAFGMLFPEERMFIFPLPVPIKAKWFVMGYAAIEVALALAQNGDGVAHVAHLGGMLFGWILLRIWRRTKPGFNGWDGYEVKDSSKTILGRIRSWLHLDKDNDVDEDLNYGHKNTTSKHQQDWEYNEKKNKEKSEREAKIDAILDKIRQSGYASLTEEEKKTLFDQRK